jgi:WD domain, G-beta repeat
VGAVRDEFAGVVALLGTAESSADRAAAVFLSCEVAGPGLRRWLLRHAHLIARGGTATLLREALASEELRPLARAALAGPGAPRLRAEPVWTTRRPARDARLWTHETGASVVHAAFDATGDHVRVCAGGPLAETPESQWHVPAWFVTLSGEGERRLAWPVGQPREDRGTFAISPGGSLLAIREWRETAVFALPGYDRLHTLRRFPMEGPQALRFLDERRLLVLDSNSLQMWDARTGVMLAEQPSTGWADLAVSPDGRHVVVTGAGATDDWYGPHALHELPSLRLARRFTTAAIPRANHPHTAAIDFRPSGRSVVTGDWNNEVWLWDLSLPDHEEEDPATVGLVPATRLGHHDGAVETVRFVDEHTVASGGNDGAVRIWDTREPGRVRRLGSHSGAITALDVSPDRRTLLSAAIDGTVSVWDLTAPGDDPPQWTASYRDWQPTLTDPVDDNGIPAGALGVEGDYGHRDPARLRLDVYEVDRLVDTIHLDGAPARSAYLDTTTFAILDRDHHVTVWRLA